MLRWRTCEEIIKRGFAQLMKAEGLAKADRNWRRGHDESRLVLNLEASSSSAGENSKFAINLDVFAAAIVEKGWTSRIQPEGICSKRKSGAAHEKSPAVAIIDGP